MLPASEAARRLGISQASLYCYVSRRLIRAFKSPSNHRERLYPASDIAELLHKKLRSRRPTAAASTALDSGLPVLETSITQINDGRPFYRGKDALELACRITLEETACLLWRRRYRGPFIPLRKPALDFSALPPTPIERVVTALALSQAIARGRDGLHSESDVLQFVAAASMGVAAKGDFIHQRLARLWKLNAAGEQLIRQTLVLCADHELSASAFAVRVVASTGASLPNSITAGLTALSGPRHAGGEILRVQAVLDRLEDPAARARLARRVRAGERAPGFGHRLYPEGDPRARAILAQLSLKSVEHFLMDIHADIGLEPVLSFALAAMERTIGLPAGAALVLLTTGRTAGWIAHALEQQKSGLVIRPRARYVEPSPR